MKRELKEVKSYNEDINYNSYRVRCLEDGKFNIQFGEIIEEEKLVNIHINTDFNAEDFKQLLKSIFLSCAEYNSLTDKDIIDEALEELNEEFEEENEDLNNCEE